MNSDGEAPSAHSVEDPPENVLATKAEGYILELSDQSASGYKGVYQRPDGFTFRASVVLNDKKIHLGGVSPSSPLISNRIERLEEACKAMGFF